MMAIEPVSMEVKLEKIKVLKDAIKEFKKISKRRIDMGTADWKNPKWIAWRKELDNAEKECMRLFKAYVEIFLYENDISANIRSEFRPGYSFGMTTIHNGAGINHPKVKWLNKISIGLDVRGKAVVISQKCTTDPKFMQPTVEKFRVFIQEMYDLLKMKEE